MISAGDGFPISPRSSLRANLHVSTITVEVFLVETGLVSG